jgi:phage terminase large subunit-like protein|nr:MAG TPA: Terminase large subunit [Caudoviricetes sp.]
MRWRHCLGVIPNGKGTKTKGYPKLKNYKPSQFMLPTSRYDKKKADRAVTFIENLCHTKGKWAGTPFWLLPWQEQLIRDIFGIVKPDGNRQFRTAFVEICKKVGKSELAAAVALYLLYADNEPSAEVYGAAADRQQASIVFDVAKQMVEMSPALMKRSKLMGATKRIVNYSNAGYYQVLSAEVGGKHGFSVSGLVFDEIHTQPNRQLYDVLTKGSSDARQNPLHFIITTAGNDRHSIAYELHTKAVDILEGRRVDPTFYPVVYGLKDDEDWEDEENWYKVNPSLGYTVDIERLRDAYREAKQNPADEITFKWLRCNMWVSSTVAWIPDAIYMRGNESIEAASLEGRDCYAGLDLSSTGDITALVLIFPPRDENEKYVLLPYFWIPEETIPRRVKANSVPYDIWEKQGYIMSTEGNVIHYDFIEKFIIYLSEKYHILEIAVDRWNATQMIQNLEGEGFTIVPFGQGFSSMSAPTKEFYRLLMEGRIIHGGNPVLRWMAGNVVIDTDPAGNIKVTKAKSKEKIDGIVAAIMALDRCIRQEGQSGSVYDERGLLVF